MNHEATIHSSKVVKKDLHAMSMCLNLYTVRPKQTLKRSVSD